MVSGVKFSFLAVNADNDLCLGGLIKLGVPFPNAMNRWKTSKNTHDRGLPAEEEMDGQNGCAKINLADTQLLKGNKHLLSPYFKLKRG